MVRPYLPYSNDYRNQVILSDPALGFKGVEDRAKAIVAAVPHAHMLDQVR